MVGQRLECEGYRNHHRPAARGPRLLSACVCGVCTCEETIYASNVGRTQPLTAHTHGMYIWPSNANTSLYLTLCALWGGEVLNICAVQT